MRCFKVLDSSNIGMGRTFQGQTLEYVGESMIPEHVVLRQPPVDAKGNQCSGVVTFSLANVVEVEVPNELS